MIPATFPVFPSPVTRAFPGPIAETAPAKINLTLAVPGRQASGYHELASLVVFAAGAADGIVLHLHPGPETAVRVSGPFAAAIGGENILTRTLDLARDAWPSLAAGTVRLDKRLPVAAGIGGGSADAAALLRALARADPGFAETVDLAGLARQIGADVPVCLAARASFMQGTGERVMSVPGLPPLWAVLVNPQTPVPAHKTAEVFRRLGAPPLPDGAAFAAPVLRFRGWSSLMAYLACGGNDLEPAATAVMPEIAAVLAALRGVAGCALARLSGAGPTCFGLFETAAAAEQAALALRRACPRWWVAATALV